MSPEALAQVLRPLAELFPAGSRPEILAGLAAGDDPYEFGAVAAANSLSDVCAVGGEPVLALNIAGFPSSLPPDMIEQVFRGGAKKAREAGCVVVGGHTITSEEPLYGLAVVGFADPNRLFLKTGVRPGDALLLTKPIGWGSSPRLSRRTPPPRRPSPLPSPR